MRHGLLIAGALGAAVMLTAAVAPRGPVALARIKTGGWQLRSLDQSAASRRICLADPADLIQLRHPGAGCSRFVVTNEADVTAIHYTCSNAGYGRTTIKVETPELIRIESQGLANQAPFQLEVEGRRVGACGGDQAQR